MNIDVKTQVTNKSNEELLKIDRQYDQYQEAFIGEVEEELKKRGIAYRKIKEQADQRKEALDSLAATGEPGDKTFIILGFVSACLGGLLGIVAGYVYSRSKRTSLSGARYYAYDQKTRDYGNAMMFVGIVVFLLALFLRFTS